MVHIHFLTVNDTKITIEKLMIWVNKYAGKYRIFQFEKNNNNFLKTFAVNKFPSRLIFLATIFIIFIKKKFF